MWPPPVRDEVWCVTRTTPRWQRWRNAGRALGFFCVVVLAMVVGCAAVVGVAVVIVWPSVFLTVGWIVFALGIGLAARLLPEPRRRRVGVATLAVLTLLGGFALLWPGPTSTPSASASAHHESTCWATSCLAAHPDRVAKVIFASPGPMVGGASDVTDLLGRPGTHLGSVLAKALPPRALLTWTIDQVDSRAARAYVGDADGHALPRDQRGRRTGPVLPSTRRADGGDVGFYANATLLRPTAWRDPHPALRHLTTPALVIKGSCDYLNWSSEVDYRDTLRNAQMVYLPDAGHRAYAERPAAFFAAVTAFLAGKPLPLPTYTGSAVPSDYQGPHG
jgi:hypothetical protein